MSIEDKLKKYIKLKDVELSKLQHNTLAGQYQEILLHYKKGKAEGMLLGIYYMQSKLLSCSSKNSIIDNENDKINYTRGKW